MASIQRTTAKLFYYARNVMRDIAPQAFFRRRLADRLEKAAQSDEAVRRRLNYYNKLQDAFSPSPDAVRIDNLPSTRSMYYYDLKEFARYFDPGLRLDLEFGDVIEVPKVPSFVKNRPIHADNGNALIMKFNKFRHFHMPADAVRSPTSFRRWSGAATSTIRSGHGFSTRCATCRSATSGRTSEVRRREYSKPFLSISQHLRYRYIVSLEGNDVATNLKWIMNSNSLCLMPPPTYETWFAESQLEANVHYVPLDPDFADLTDKVSYFEKHPAAAERIVAAANAYCRKFSNEWSEQAISLLVALQVLCPQRPD